MGVKREVERNSTLCIESQDIPLENMGPFKIQPNPCGERMSLEL
jgi:hypothetical protein